MLFRSIAVAATCFAHAILAARGEWITNEKSLPARAGPSAVDEVVESLTRDPAVLRAGIGTVRALCRSELEKICGNIELEMEPS